MKQQTPFRDTVHKGWLPSVAGYLGVSKQAAHKWLNPPEHHKEMVKKLRHQFPHMFKNKRGK